MPNQLPPHPLYPAEGPQSIRPDILAKGLMDSLLDGKTFEIVIPDMDGALYQMPPDTLPAVTEITNDELTTGVVNGSGVFDKLMTSLVAHLQVEYKANRISGAEYTKAYSSIVGTALGTAVQFLLGKDQAYWQAVLAREQARMAEINVITARVGLETAKVNLSSIAYQALTAEAGYSLTKLKLSTEDAQFNLIRRNIDQLTFNIDNMLPLQVDMLEEQVATQRAQTRDTLLGGGVVTGFIGKQKALYDQQIASYQRDAEMKALKPFMDAWITMKTVDEGFPTPESFDIVPLNELLNDIKARNNIGSFTPDAPTPDVDP
jgi:hypothetical protein